VATLSLFLPVTKQTFNSPAWSVVERGASSLRRVGPVLRRPRRLQRGGPRR